MGAFVLAESSVLTNNITRYQIDIKTAVRFLLAQMRLGVILRFFHIFHTFNRFTLFIQYSPCSKGEQ